MSENPNTAEQQFHSWRTEIPNIIWDLGLDPYEITVYCYLKRVAGDHGKCFQSRTKMAESCGMCERKFRQVKNSLARPRLILGNLPLINIQKRTTNLGDSDTDLITINNIWPTNFQKYNGESLHSPGGGTNLPEGGETHAPKEQHLKKIPIKKDNVSLKKYGKTLESDERKILPEKRWKLNKTQAEAFYWLKEHKINTAEGTIAFWCKTYSFHRLKEVFEYALANSDGNVGGYMNKILKKGSIVQNESSKINKQTAHDFKSQTHWGDLILHENYAKVLTASGSWYEIPYNLDYITFFVKLQELHDNNK